MKMHNIRKFDMFHTQINYQGNQIKQCIYLRGNAVRRSDDPAIIEQGAAARELLREEAGLDYGSLPERAHEQTNKHVYIIRYPSSKRAREELYHSRIESIVRAYIDSSRVTGS